MTLVLFGTHPASALMTKSNTPNTKSRNSLQISPKIFVTLQLLLLSFSFSDQNISRKTLGLPAEATIHIHVKQNQNDTAY